MAFFDLSKPSSNMNFIIDPNVVSGGSFSLISLLKTPFDFLMSTTSSSSVVEFSVLSCECFFIIILLKKNINNNNEDNKKATPVGFEPTLLTELT